MNRPLRAYAEVALGRQRSPAHDTGPFMVPYLRAANVKDGYLDLTDVKEMNFTPTEQKVFSLKPGDVLVTEGSGSLSAVGASAVWDGEIDGVVCFQNTLLRIRPRPGTDGRYLARWCRSAFGDGLFASSTTGANIFHLSSERVRELPMARVPIADQNVIADYLDAETQHLNTLIASKSHLRGLLAERRQATTWLGVSGSLTNPVCSALAPSGIPWTSELPVGWRAARLNLIARLGSGHTPSRDHPEWWQDCTIPWITTGEVAQVRDDRIEYVDSTRESISELGMANSSAELHPAETVVLSRTASAGFSAIMRSEMATSQDFATWCCGPLLRPRFLLLCLRAMRSDLLDRLAQGSTHKTIYMPDIASIKIPLPSIVEQDKIVEKVWIDLKRIERLDAQLQRQIDLLVERRQALITAAVTGKLDVPGAET